MKKRSIHSVTDELGEYDGIDPRDEKKHRIGASNNKRDYSALRLASQIREILNLVIPYSGNALLTSFIVGHVEPYGIGSNFVVQVYSTDHETEYDPNEIKVALNNMKSKLRMEVAKNVTRKKAPDFKFDVLPPRVQPR
jgi:ribosome-binding factor A